MINKLVEVIDEDPESENDSIIACYMCVCDEVAWMHMCPTC